MRGLFLDDERSPSDVTWVNYDSNIDWTVVRTFDEFCYFVDTHVFSVYSFDHDIQDFETIKKGDILRISVYGNVYAEDDTVEELTGKDCAEYLKDNYEYNYSYYVHSKNPVGKQNIINVLGKERLVYETW